MRQNDDKHVYFSSTIRNTLISHLSNMVNMLIVEHYITWI